MAPSPGEVITSGEVILAVAAGTDLGTPRFSLGDRDLSLRFAPGGERNLKMGGGRMYVAWLSVPGDMEEGEQRFRVEAEGKDARKTVEVRFQVEEAALSVEYEVLEDRPEGRMPVAARLTFIGLEGTEDPELAQASAGRVDPTGRERHRSFTDTAAGRGRAGLPAGRYAVVASHGLQWSVDVARVEGRGLRHLGFVLHPLARRPDTWVCDFHVHGLASPDSALPPAIRLRAYRAAGMDLLVAADHNRIADYRPFQAKDSPLLAVPGIEAGLQAGGPAGPRSIGHWTLWPLAGAGAEADVNGKRLVVKSVPPVLNGEAYQVYGRFQTDPEVARRLEESGETDLEPIIQLNHPRGVEPPLTGRVQRDKAYFQALGLDPDRPMPDRDDGGPNSFLRRTSPDGRFSNGSFDAIELYNRASLPLYLEVRRDYFALLRAGMAAASVGNTDSHSLAAMPGGAPVNLVRLPPAPPGSRQDRAGRLAALMIAVRAGHLITTTGPDLHLTVSAGGSTGGPGDLIRTADGRVTARLEITAPDWIPVEEVRWYLDGKLQAVDGVDSPVHRGEGLPPDYATGILRRWSLTRRFHLEEDGFLFVEAGEKLPEDPRRRPPSSGIYGKVIPRQWSLAFANPIRIDVGEPGWKPAAGR